MHPSKIYIERRVVILQNTDIKAKTFYECLIDTNILIDHPQYFYTNNCIIPIETLIELDKLKNTDDYKKRKRINAAINHLMNYIENSEIVIDEKEIKAINNEYCTETLFVNCDRIDEIVSPNDIVIATSARKYDYPLVTKDKMLYIYCMLVGIPCEYIDKKEIEVYTGIKEIYVEPEIIDKLYKKGFVKIDGEEFYSNQAVKLINKYMYNNIAYGIYNSNIGAVEEIKHTIKAFGIEPKNKNIKQTIYMNMLMNEDIRILTAVSQAGAGKTLLSLACALELVNGKKPKYEKIIVARGLSEVGEEKIGYLPGDKEEKIDSWHDALYDAFETIMRKNRKINDIVPREHLKMMMMQNRIEIGVISFMRGRSLNNSFIIIDEAQNITPDVIRTIITRCGENTKIVLIGDPTQIDNNKCTQTNNGLVHIIESLYDKDIDIYGHVTLDQCERGKIAEIGIKYL